MALAPCPECGHKVSTQAASCPACGYPMQGTRGVAQQAPPRQPQQPAIQSPRVWSNAILALGAWLITPWIAKLVVAVVALVVAYFLFRGH